MISPFYSLIIMITIIVMFILIQYKVQLTINSSKNEDVIEILQNVRLYFVLTISMLSIKTLNYFLKKNNEKMEFLLFRKY
jgi:uncharacterized membrane protein